jgi:hypothetical protein
MFLADTISVTIAYYFSETLINQSHADLIYKEG